MSHIQERLFNLQPYMAGTVADVLNKPVNQQLNVTEYYRIVPRSLQSRAFVCGNGSPTARIKNSKAYVPPETFSDPTYHQYLDGWVESSLRADDPPEGFLLGFPYITTPHGRMLTMNIHALMDDITSSWAVPVNEISQVLRYSDDLAQALARDHNAMEYKNRTDLEREVALGSPLGKLALVPALVYGDPNATKTPFSRDFFVL